MRNVYPVIFDEFIRFKRLGTYTVTYAILDDRMHFEMAIENSIFVTQKFIKSIENEMKEKAENYEGTPIEYILKTYLNDNILYKYYPTEKTIEWMKIIKLYKKLTITEINHDNYIDEDFKVVETDTEIFTYNYKHELYMKAKKVL